MTPAASSPAVRARMRAQPTRDTTPEVALRRELHALGLRFRLHRRFLFREGVRRTVDVVLPGPRVAVQVHGCYWHGCARCKLPPSGSNAEWWSRKIERNRERDVDTTRRLRAEGWAVVTVWEHENPARAARRVLQAVVRQEIRRERST